MIMIMVPAFKRTIRSSIQYEYPYELDSLYALEGGGEDVLKASWTDSSFASTFTANSIKVRKMQIPGKMEVQMLQKYYFGRTIDTE